MLLDEGVEVLLLLLLDAVEVVDKLLMVLKVFVVGVLLLLLLLNILMVLVLLVGCRLVHRLVGGRVFCCIIAAGGGKLGQRAGGIGLVVDELLLKHGRGCGDDGGRRAILAGRG